MFQSEIIAHYLTASHSLKHGQPKETKKKFSFSVEKMQANQWAKKSLKIELRKFGCFLFSLIFWTRRICCFANVIHIRANEIEKAAITGYWALFTSKCKNPGIENVKIYESKMINLAVENKQNRKSVVTKHLKNKSPLSCFAEISVE